MIAPVSPPFQQRPDAPPGQPPAPESEAAVQPAVANSAAPNGRPLTDDQRRRVEELKRIDAEVRAHEAAHAAAAGGLARGMSLRTTTGPDGRQYAVGGEVKIDILAVPGNPRATIAKMQTVRRAALAPADPSGQDRSVAALAAAAEAQARAEISAENEAKSAGSKPGQPSRTANADRLTNAYRKTTVPQSTFTTVETCTVCQTSLACNHLAATSIAGLAAAV
jgi:hypothetical protein